MTDLMQPFIRCRIALLNDIYKKIEELPFARMDLGKNWEAKEWVSKEQLLDLIKELTNLLKEL